MNKPIEEINKFDGKINKLYYSLESAQKSVKVSKETLERIIARGLEFNHKYYRYYYQEDYKEIYDKFPVKVYDEEGKLLYQFRTIQEASDAMGTGYTRKRIGWYNYSKELDPCGRRWVIEPEFDDGLDE